jgi:hypothetical protein
VGSDQLRCGRLDPKIAPALSSQGPGPSMHSGTVIDTASSIGGIQRDDRWNSVSPPPVAPRQPGRVLALGIGGRPGRFAPLVSFYREVSSRIEHDPSGAQAATQLGRKRG